MTIEVSMFFPPGSRCGPSPVAADILACQVCEAVHAPYELLRSWVRSKTLGPNDHLMGSICEKNIRPGTVR